MSRFKTAFSVAAFLLLAVAFWAVWHQAQAPGVQFDLPDGSTIRLRSVMQGKELRFHEGNIFQRAIYSMCHTNVPSLFGGIEVKLPSLYTNGGVGIELRHKVTGRSAFALRLAQIIGADRLVQLDSRGRERNGDSRGCIFTPAFATSWRVGTPGRKQTLTEDSIWEFPISDERELHFRLYLTTPTKNVVTTNDFTIPNPSFK